MKPKAVRAPSLAWLLTLILLLLLPPSVAQSATGKAVSADITYTYKVSPAHVYAEGEISLTLKISVANGTESQFADLHFFNLEGRSYNLSGKVYSGSSQSVTIDDIFISDESFGKSLSCYLVYTDFSGSLMTLPGDITIKKSQPELTIEREVSPLSALPGDVIYITYKIKNPSGNAFTSISVTDPAVGDVAAIELLESGDSIEIMKEVIFRQPFYSQPVMTSTQSGAEVAKEQSLPAVNVEYAETGLEITLFTDAEAVDPGESFALTGIVRNLSGAEMSDLHIYCEMLGAEVFIDALPQNGSYVFSQSVQPIADRAYVLKTTATNGDGRLIEAQSNPVEIDVRGDENVDSAVLQAYSNYFSPDIVFSVSANVANLVGPGEVNFQFKLHNSMGKLTNIRVYEKKLGELLAFDTLVVGDKSTTLALNLEETTRLNFVFEAIDSNGLPVISEADPIIVEVQSDSNAALDPKTLGNTIVVSTEAITLSSSSGLSVPLISLLVALGALIIIGAVVLLALYIRENFIYGSGR